MSKNLDQPFYLVERFKIDQFMGDGAFGTVYRGICLETNEVVAIKKFKRKFTS
jgi:serine/threonine protein kinase